MHKTKSEEITIESIWHITEEKPHFNTLTTDTNTKVLIIGGGITGILCAYRLQEAGVPYILAEADGICSHVTGNTTAKLTLQHGLIYDKIIKRYGLGTAGLYYDAQNEALTRWRNILKDKDCDYKEYDSFVYSLNDRKKIESEVSALNKIGCDAEFCEQCELPLKTAGAVRVKNQAVFNPLKALYSIAENLNIFENTRVLELTPEGALTKHGKITAESIIVATHFPFINKHGSYFLKMYQDRSYVLALKNAQQLKGMYVDESGKGLSFRNHGDLLLLGGGSHRTGKNGTAFGELEQFAKENYKTSEEVCRWATQDCMTLDDIPYIGRYSKNTPDMFVATGFNKWGMSSAMVAAGILCDCVLGKPNRYAHVFSPSRSILHKKLAVNAAEAVCNLLTPTAPRCPHLGCALKYNKQEHSWDCPCHGSRFDPEGKLLDNPATGDCKVK